MNYPACRPSPWLLAPATVALVLLGVAHRDIVFPALCFLCLVGSYFHPWHASRPRRHPWVVSIVTCAVLFCLCVLYYWIWLLNGEGLTYFRRFWYKPWMVSTGAMLQALVLLWAWHLPSRATGMIFACLGLIAISSGNILPSSYGIINLYALFGGACLLSLFVLSGAFYGGRDQPFRERCRQSLVILSCIATIGAGTWYVSMSIQHVGQVLDTLLADFMSGSHYRDAIGAGNSIRIAHQRQIRLSRRVVATLSGSQSPVYLRTQVLTQYQNHRWTPSSNIPPQPLSRGNQTGPDRVTQDIDHREVRLHVNLRGAVPLPYSSDQIHVPQPLSCLQTEGAIVQCMPSSQLTSYAFKTVEPGSHIPFGIGFALRASDRPSSRSILTQSLQDARGGPETVLSQLRPIARHIAGAEALHAPLAAAQKIQQYFRQHFAYSLHVKLAPERDPIVDFIQHRRPAYCEYFASGMALMLRALGIPARVVGGFVVWEYNTLLQQWIVRQRDAHAWVEVYDDTGQRWIGFDATPAFRQAQFDRTGMVGFLDQSRAWIELQVRAVVKSLYQIDFIAWMIQLRQLRAGFGAMVGQSLLPILLLASAYWLWRRFRRAIALWWKQLKWPRRWRPRHRSDTIQANAVQAEALQHFDRLVTLLQQRGAPILPTETLEDYRQRMSLQDMARPDGPTWASPPLHIFLNLLADFNRAYNQLRFRPWPTEPEARQVFLQQRLLCLRRITDQLQQIHAHAVMPPAHQSFFSTHCPSGSRFFRLMSSHPNRLEAKHHNSPCTTNLDTHRTSSAQIAADSQGFDKLANTR